MERMILYRFSHFLESNNLLSFPQHVFRRGHSSMEAVAALREAIATAFKKRNMKAAVFFDFVMAFDTVLPSYVLTVSSPSASMAASSNTSNLSSPPGPSRLG
jgi:hypothetical protein